MVVEKRVQIDAKPYANGVRIEEEDEETCESAESSDEIPSVAENAENGVTNDSKSYQPRERERSNRGVMSCKFLCLLIFVLFGYTILGGYAFLLLEQEYEQDQIASRKPIDAYLQEFLAEYPDVDAVVLEDTVVAVLNSYVNGTLAWRQGKLRWSFDSAVFFAATMLTTIGYGDLAPSTQGGKLFTVLFALIGIPLNLMVIATIGTKIIGRTLDVANWLFRGDKGAVRMSPRNRKIFSLAGVILVGVIVFLLLPSYLFAIIEGWSFLDAFYFSFVTLSTIGIGDYVIGYVPQLSDASMAVYRICSALWLFLGLTWLSTILAAQQGLCRFCARVGDEKRRRWTQRRRDRSMSRLAIVSQGSIGLSHSSLEARSGTTSDERNHISRKNSVWF